MEVDLKRRVGCRCRGKVGSRLFLSVDSRDLAMSARKWFRTFGDFPGGSRVGWRSQAEVEIPIVFPVSLVGTELRPTTCTVLETAICVGSVLFVLMLFEAHYKFCP